MIQTLIYKYRQPELYEKRTLKNAGHPKENFETDSLPDAEIAEYDIKQILNVDLA